MKTRLTLLLTAALLSFGALNAHSAEGDAVKTGAPKEFGREADAKKEKFGREADAKKEKFGREADAKKEKFGREADAKKEKFGREADDDATQSAAATK